MATINPLNIPTAASGTILQGQGVGTTSGWSTATYPSSTTSQQILYSTATNTVGQLTTANSKFPATNASGTLAMRAFSINVQKFTYTGSTQTYTPSTGMFQCIIEAVGAGGGSGGVGGATGSASSGGVGGSGGEYGRNLLTSAQIGSSQTITIGAGGSAGASGGGNGGNGGNTSIGTLLVCIGGGGGIYYNNAAAGVAYGIQGGYGGTASAGQYFFIQGGAGGTASNISTAAFGSFGGSSYFCGITPAVVSNSAGLSPLEGYGGGAAGATATNSTANAGAAGAPGVVIITEYIIN
jgi:hypothetical protein